MSGTLLRASATYCVGITERSDGNDLPHSQTAYRLDKRSGYALVRIIEKRNLLSKKVVCFKYGRTVSAKVSKLQYQTKTTERFRD